MARILKIANIIDLKVGGGASFRAQFWKSVLWVKNRSVRLCSSRKTKKALFNTVRKGDRNRSQKEAAEEADECLTSLFKYFHGYYFRLMSHKEEKERDREWLEQISILNANWKTKEYSNLESEEQEECKIDRQRKMKRWTCIERERVIKRRVELINR